MGFVVGWVFAGMHQPHYSSRTVRKWYIGRLVVRKRVGRYGSCVPLALAAVHQLCGCRVDRGGCFKWRAGGHSKCRVRVTIFVWGLCACWYCTTVAIIQTYQLNIRAKVW